MRVAEKTLFAIKVVRRRVGLAGVVYRRQPNQRGQERLIRVAAISPLAFSAASALLRNAAQAKGQLARLAPGPFLLLDPDWGVKVACYALVCRGLRDPERMHRTAEHLKQADSVEAAWWFGLMTRGRNVRAVRALRILLEAVK